VPLSRNLGTITSWNPLGHSRPVTGLLYLFTAIHYKLLATNTLPYYRYKPEPVLESAIMILYWDKSIVTDKMVHFNKSEIVLNDRQNKTALVIDTAVPLSNNLPRTEAEKIMKY
jgi:hypothetical protein